MGYPLVSRWALHPASVPQPNLAFPGTAGEGEQIPAGPRAPRDVAGGTPQSGSKWARWVTEFVGSGVPVSQAAPPFYGTFSLPPNQGVIFAPLSLLCSAGTGNFGRARVENPEATNSKRPLSASPLHSLFIIILFFIF